MQRRSGVDHLPVGQTQMPGGTGHGDNLSVGLSFFLSDRVFVVLPYVLRGWEPIVRIVWVDPTIIRFVPLFPKVAADPYGPKRFTDLCLCPVGCSDCVGFLNEALCHTVPFDVLFGERVDGGNESPQLLNFKEDSDGKNGVDLGIHCLQLFNQCSHLVDVH